MKKKVSIIVPIYNAEKYLKKCIRSLITQTYRNLEILLVDDGSTDNSLKICNNFKKKDSRIKVFSIQKSGVSTARNIGIKNSTGTYITFVDSDDWVEQRMIEMAVKKIEETESDIVIWSFYRNYPKKEVEFSFLPYNEKVFTRNKDILYLRSISAGYGKVNENVSASLGSVWCKLYRSKLIADNKLQFKTKLTRAQDVVFTINAFKHASKISYFDKSLYHYRISNTSTTSGTRFIENTKEPFNLLLNELEKFIVSIENDHKDHYYTAFYARVIQVLQWHLDHNFFHPKLDKTLRERRKRIIKLLNTEPYKSALKKVDNKLLSKKEKVMTLLFRRKLILFFYIIYRLDKKIKNKT